MTRILWRSAAVSALILCAGTAAWRLDAARKEAGPGASNSTGRNLLKPLPDEGTLTPLLDRLGWDDIAPTAAGTEARASLRRETLAATATSSRAEILYLRALLLMAEGQPEVALATFGGIPLDRIPPAYLYAPYRLHGDLRRGQPNPYFNRLVEARRAASLPPLIAARVAAAEGDLRAALQGYVASDPSQWAQHDLVAFRAMRLHGGFAPDTATLLGAAVRGGRVPTRLQPEIMRILSTDRGATLTDLRSTLRARLEESPDLRRIAASAIGEQIRIRRLFLSHQYALLVEEHRARDFASIADGTLVLLVISASRVGDAVLVDRFAQEIRRRYPEPEVIAWLGGLRRSSS